MRRIVTLVGIGGGLALLAVGMVQPKDNWWLAALWGGMLLLAIGATATVQALQGGVRRGVLHLALTFSLLFVMLTAQLLRTQFVQANAIYKRVVKTEAGTTSNPRPVTRSLKVRRGGIYDRNGVQLVGSEANPQGFAKRTYPVAQIGDIRAFSNILGYTSPNYGQDGLEAQWDEYLNGTKGQPIRALQDDVLNRPHIGDDMQLTINAQLQDAVWQELVRLGGGRPGSVVVLDPRTGAILALASAPGYDPQALTFDPFAEDWEAMGQRIAGYWSQLNGDPQLPLINRPLQGRYAPGSTFKTVTAIAALQHPAVLQDPQPIDCPNEYKPNPNAPPVVNAVPNLQAIIQRGMNGKVDLTGVYAFSCNTAFAQLGIRLGREVLTEQSQAFNIYPPRVAPDASPDMTDLPTEASLLALRGTFLESKPEAVADTAYGQGQLLVTPMQMALVTAAVANDGLMPQPYLVEKITTPGPEPSVAYQHTARPQLLQKRAMPSDVAAQMRELMRVGVTTGFGKAAAVAGQTVGGKSGSAQAGLNDPNDIVHAWFTAIAPVEQPRYVVAVMVENGRDGAGLGAALAGAVLRVTFDIME